MATPEDLLRQAENGYRNVVGMLRVMDKSPANPLPLVEYITTLDGAELKYALAAAGHVMVTLQQQNVYEDTLAEWLDIFERTILDALDEGTG